MSQEIGYYRKWSRLITSGYVGYDLVFTKGFRQKYFCFHIFMFIRLQNYA